MPFNRLSTAKVARSVGVHPNTVRLYERWGFLSPVARSETGYRLFTEMHIDQMRLARLVLGAPWVGRAIRRAGMRAIRLTAAMDLRGALAVAADHLELVRQEREQAEAAAEVLRHWAGGLDQTQADEGVLIGEVARRLHLTRDTLRNWERNGLLSVPRDAGNTYRHYGPAEIPRLRIIRLLVRSGYSLMAVRRALGFRDQGLEGDLVLVIDTPMPGEEILSAADRWLSALDDQERRGLEMVALLEMMIQKYGC